MSREAVVSAEPAPAGERVDRLCIDAIRALAMDAVEKAKSGHPGMPMAMAPVAYLLYTRYLRHNPRDPGWPDRDRFVLSAGHGSMLLYSVPAPVRLRPAPGGAQALPAVGIADARPP
jgi:transketolase